MEILQQIQSDLVGDSTPLSSTLRKAMILASQLKSDELKGWVEKEIDGYQSISELPDYRIIDTLVCIGKWTNGYQMVTNKQVPLWKIPEEKLRQAITTFPVYEGIRAVEAHSKNEDLKYILPLVITTKINQYVGKQGAHFIELEYPIHHQDFEKILDTVKTRLLKFVIKLNENWNFKSDKPTNDQIIHLVSHIVYNIQEGGNMSIFNQQGQTVNYQYNAAGNININSIQSIEDLTKQLENLQIELKKARDAKAIDQDKAVEAEYHLLQATKEAKKKKPNKKTFIDNIKKAKISLQDVAAVVSIAEALPKIIDLARQFFS